MFTFASLAGQNPVGAQDGVGMATHARHKGEICLGRYASARHGETANVEYTRDATMNRQITCETAKSCSRGSKQRPSKGRPGGDLSLFVGGRLGCQVDPAFPIPFRARTVQRTENVPEFDCH
eukprot:5809895-Pyramimonas_sp.AAC.3